MDYVADAYAVSTPGGALSAPSAAQPSALSGRISSERAHPDGGLSLSVIYRKSDYCVETERVVERMGAQELMADSGIASNAQEKLASRRPGR